MWRWWKGLDFLLQPATFMNQASLKLVGGLDACLRWSLDWDLSIQLAKVSLPFAIEAKLAASREWGNMLTANDGFRCVEEIRRMAERHSGAPMTRGALCYWIDNMYSRAEASPDAFSGHTRGACAISGRKFRPICSN